ncbi:MAG: diaminopropionate ammonia-lyase [Gammaproteobacteria bacterium]|nr:diaminopropionate ammonia-lyase [Gammaproteobacteria bacterium]
MKKTNPVFADARIGHHANRRRAAAADYPEALRRHFSLAATAEAAGEISAWPGYRPSALTPLRGLAAEFGLGAIHYKDESGRFGLGSFKALGGAYAVLGVLQQQIQGHTGERASARDLEGGRFSNLAARTTVVTATDGNHGRSVAWGAARFGCGCRIYIHAKVSERRARAMSELGAEVVRIRGNYDESVRLAAAHADANGWHLVSDTSQPGYTDLPARVMAGYSVMMEEIVAQLPSRPPRAGAGFTHVFVQGGVGGLAASVAAYLWEKWGAGRPRFIVVEPQLAACLFQSARQGRATEVRITEETVMAGLSCGEVSMLAWEVLSAAADDFLTIADDLVAPVMRMLAHGEARVEAGESAVAGLAACLAACANPPLAAALGLNQRSQVLVFGTEGATDRDIYRAMVS